MSASIRFARPALAGLLVAVASVGAFVEAGAQQRRPQRQQPAAAAAASPPTRIPPPGPAEVPLFPARPYVDQRSQLNLMVPAGWLLVEVPQVPEGEITRMFMDGPGTPAPNCTIVVIRPQQPQGATQAVLNRAIHNDQQVDRMRRQLSSEGRRVVSIRKVTQSGVAGVVAQVAIPGNQYSPELTVFVSIFEQVGRRYSINCNSLSADLDTMRPDINAILESLRFRTG